MTKIKFISVAVSVSVSIFGSIITSAATPRASESNADKQLMQIIDESTEQIKHLDPYAATYFNVEEDLSKFGDFLSPDYFAREKALFKSSLNKLKKISPKKLSEKNILVYRLFKERTETDDESLNFPNKYLGFNQMGNRLHSYIDSSSQQLTHFPFDSVKHYQDYIERSKGFPAFVEWQIENLKTGLKKHIVLNCPAANGAIKTYQEALVTDVERNPFWRPILFMPKTFGTDDRKRLTSQFREMISARILPAFQKFSAFYEKEYVPHCRKEYGIGALPNGKKWYAFQIYSSTGLHWSAQKIHEIGLKEVVRISGEIAKVQKEMGNTQSLQDFLHGMRDNPKNYFSSQQELFRKFEEVKTRVAERLPQYFSLLPKSDYKIVMSSNPRDAAGQYYDPTEMQPFGRFVVGMNLKAVPIFEATTLSLHETNPGHHLQIALQFEMKDKLTEYQRKIYFSNAFVEGWALYAEYLGREMGMFKDPLQRFGNLNDELWRAVRLVVDTGIHAYGWDREKALGYMKEFTALDGSQLEIEADRYSVWPGQALAYKIGQLKILELRQLAEKTLGPKFDIREFHKAVVGNGTVSLSVLDDQIHNWLR